MHSLTGYKKKLLRCNWCKKSVLGNTFKSKHGGGKPGHEYLSYNITKFGFMLGGLNEITALELFTKNYLI